MACGIALLCAAVGGAQAQQRTPSLTDDHSVANSESACDFESLASGKVASIVDGRSFVLEDGREVRIAGIEVPSTEDPSHPNHLNTAGTRAKAALASLLLGETVELQGPSLVNDRYGRTVAFVHLPKMAESAAHAMLAMGHAWAAGDVGNTACGTEILSRERVARTAKLGLWADPRYEVREAGDGPQLLAALGHFTVVEGRVLSVRESGGTIYLNFGPRWSEALTVTISKRRERIFSAAGIEPRRLEHRKVRVRGWIEERNGPRIEASRPEQIEAGLN
jgi:endonuclease YncB( thermonuclease family)